MTTLGCVNHPDQFASNSHRTEAGSERESAGVFSGTTYVTSVPRIQSSPLASAVGRTVETKLKLEHEVGVRSDPHSGLEQAFRVFVKLANERQCSTLLPRLHCHVLLIPGL